MEERARKRPRPTFSCLECKRKKLKCDRSHPCLQCSRLGRGRECTYSDENGNGTDSSPSVNGVGERGQSNDRHSFHDLERRVAQIERRLGPGDASSTSPHPMSTSKAPVRFKQSITKKGSTTRFHSHLHWTACSVDFTDVKGFLESLGAPRMHSLREEFQELGKATKENRVAVVSTPVLSSDAVAFHDQMRSSLPNHQLCDTLTDHYFNTFNRIYPILNEEDFRLRIDSFWLGGNVGLDDTFVPQYYAIISICLKFEHDGDVAHGIPRGESRPNPNVLLKSWLSSLRGKRRLRIDVVRLEFLLALLRLTTRTRAEEVWLETGSLLQLGMAVGLHRDPTEFACFTPSEALQRRALWFAIAELCLQESMTSSMPLMLNKSQYSCQPPERADILSESFTSRCELWNTLFAMEGTIDVPELTAALQPVLSALSDLPLLHNTEPSASIRFANHVKKCLADRLVSYCYRQLVFANHNQMLDGSEVEHLRDICLDLLLLQDIWDPQISDYHHTEASRLWDMYYVFFQEDVIRSIIYLSLFIKNQNSLPVLYPAERYNSTMGDVSSSTRSDRDGARMTRVSRVIDTTIDALARRLKGADLAKDIKTAICLSIIHACARSAAMDEGQRWEFIEQAVRRTIGKCRMRLSDLAIPQRYAAVDSSHIPGQVPDDSATAYTGESSGQAHIGETALDTSVTPDMMAFLEEFDPSLYGFQTTTSDWLLDF